MLSWTIALLAVLAVLAPRQAAAQDVCTLYSAPLVEPEKLFEYTAFSDATPVNRTWTYFVDGALRLTQDETNGGVVGYAWHPRAERIADGFVSTVKFKIPQKTNPGDGFTYFIQNDKTEDLNGGSGDKLGAFGIARSIAVRIDLCPQRPNPCGNSQIGVVLVNSTFGSFNVKTETLSSSLADGVEHTIVVTYAGRLLGSSAKLRVKLDSLPDIEATVGDLTQPNFFNGRFAFFGFTASTSWSQTATIDITGWKTELVPSDSALEGFDPEKPFKFEFGTVAWFLVLRRDSCKKVINIDDNAVIKATLKQQPLEGQDPLDAFNLEGNVTNFQNGSYAVMFNLPPSLSAKWDLDVLANGVRVEGMPYVGGVESFRPAPGGGGIPAWLLAIILVIVLLIIIVLSYVVYRLYRYRKKLEQNAEFIEAGKKQAELDRLEDGVSYTANRMVGTIDDLKDQLTKNEEELGRLRNRGALGEDQNYTIEQLQKQRDALLEEMNRLKREEQEEELKRSKTTEVYGTAARGKKAFGREQI